LDWKKKKKEKGLRSASLGRCWIVGAGQKIEKNCHSFSALQLQICRPSSASVKYYKKKKKKKKNPQQNLPHAKKKRVDE
jgi:hypothetical protein